MKSSKAKAIWLAVLSVSLLAWTAASAQITPSADSYTSTATPTTNYGAKTLLDVDSACRSPTFNLIWHRFLPGQADRMGAPSGHDEKAEANREQIKEKQARLSQSKR